MKFGRMLYNIFNVFGTAKRIKADEDKRSKSVRFAISSILYSVFMIAFILCGAFLLTLNDTGILYVFLVVIAVILLGGAVIEFVGALLRVIVQLTINRKPMSWIALIIFLASVGVSVFLIVHFL